MVKKKFPYQRLWQTRLLNRRVGQDVIPIDISVFKKIRGTIGLHGYLRIRKEDKANVRAYRKDSYGTTLIYINVEEKTIEGKTETWGGLMCVCDDFGLIPYRRF